MLWRIATLIHMLAWSVLVGAGMVIVLTIPSLSARALTYFPALAAIAFFVSLPIAWLVARQIMALQKGNA